MLLLASTSSLDMPRSVSQLQAYSEVSELATLPVTPPPLQALESSAASREGKFI